MRNYAGHRLSPWLGHLMISRSETSRPLLTQGEILQLPDTDEIVMLSGSPPIKAKKARYYADPRLQARVLPPPEAGGTRPNGPLADDWSALPVIKAAQKKKRKTADDDDAANGGIRREPEIPTHVDVAPKAKARLAEFDFSNQAEGSDDAARAERLRIDMARSARQASLDPGDGIAL
jgi:type IV secretion system protein VirD4